MSRFTKQGKDLVSFLADLGQALFAPSTSLVGWWTLLVPGTVSVLLPRWRVIICLNCSFRAWHRWAGSNWRGRVWSEAVGAAVYLCWQGWSIAALCRLLGCCLHPKPPRPRLCGSSPWTVNAPWTVHSCLPLMAAAGKCNLGFSFQALRCLKLIMSFKGGGREQSWSRQSEDFEAGVTGRASLRPRGNWDGCQSFPPLSACGEDRKWQQLTQEWVRLKVKCCVWYFAYQAC